MKKTLSFFCIALLLGSLLAYLLYSLTGRNLAATLQGSDWAILLVITLIGSGVLLMGYLFLINRFAWKKGVPVRFALTMMWIWGCSILSIYLFQLYFQNREPDPLIFNLQYDAAFLLKGTVVSFILGLLITWGDFSWFVYSRFSAETLTQLQAGRKQKEIQFRVLRSQLTPHFLFNSLNTASNLTTTRPEQAEEFIRKLAFNFTHLLKHAASPINSLEKELEIVDNFFHLMQIRFGHKIMLEKRIKTACLCKKLPALSLQLLVENVIKHNVASPETPVITVITADDNQVVVVNNTTTAPKDVHSHGIGLKNLKAHYQHFSKKQLQVLQTGSHYQVILPYIEDPKTKRDV